MENSRIKNLINYLFLDFKNEKRKTKEAKSCALTSSVRLFKSALLKPVNVNV
jgi:hypothetical protein